MREKIVAHLKNGEIVKGFSRDFCPEGGDFHVMTMDYPVATSRRVEVDGLKALFFVRTWGRPTGATQRKYRFGVGGMKQEPGRRAVVRFHDGEKVWGYVLDEGNPMNGFFMVPADPADNNLKMFIIHTSIDEFRILEEGTETAH